MAPNAPSPHTQPSTATAGRGRSETPPSPARLAVRRTIGRLQPGYRTDAPWAVATVARLRREAGRDAHVSPTGWGLEHLEALAELREERRVAEAEEPGGYAADPADTSSSAYGARERQEQYEDTAVHVAVTLWALHQQSLRDEPMHLTGWPLGRAVRRLAHGKTGTRDSPAKEATPPGTPAGSPSPGTPAERVEEASETVRRRFVRIGASSDTEVLATRLRELVLLLRSARIPLDYESLADQLLRWQDENRRDTVQREWGRDFHRWYRPGVRQEGEDGDQPDVSGPPLSDLDADDVGA
jgi:CRISPR system Cascade subunit CasB